MKTYRFVTVLALLAVSLLPGAAFGASATCGVHWEAGPLTDQKMASIWVRSFAAFEKAHLELAAEQRLLLAEAIAFAVPDRFTKAAGADLSGLRELVQRLEAGLTTAQRGEIFSRMGEGQRRLVELKVLATPYCDCATLGASCAPTMPGTCKTGCITWEQQTKAAATAYVGVCSN